MSSSTGLSRSWRVRKRHEGAYSGGRVVISALPFPTQNTTKKPILLEPSLVAAAAPAGGGGTSEEEGTTTCTVGGHGRFVVCLYNENVTFLSLETGEIITKLIPEDEFEDQNESIVSFCLHPNCRELVTASRHLALRVWDLGSMTCQRTLRAHEAPVLSMCYESTGTLVATGSADRTVKVWNISKGYCTHNFRGHTGIVTCVRFHPTQLTLVTAGEDCSVRVWDLHKQECIAHLRDHMSTVTGIAFTNDGRAMITGGRDRVINMWETKRLTRIHTMPVYEAIEDIQVLPDAGFAVEESTPVSGKGGGPAGGDRDDGFLPSGLFAGVGEEGLVRVWRFAPSSGDGDSATMNVRCVTTQAAEDGAAGAGDRIGYSQLLLSRPQSSSWPAASEDSDKNEQQLLVAVTNDHNFLFLDGGLRRQRQIIGYNDDIIDIKYVPRYTPSEEEEEEDARSGNGDEPPATVAIATNSAAVRLLDLKTFSCELLQGHSDIVLALSVSPDGRWIATASKDHTARIWDLAPGENATHRRRCVALCRGHTESIGAVTFSTRASGFVHGGRGFFCTGCSDKTIKKWRVNVRELSQTPDGEPAEPRAELSVLAHDKDINALATSPNDALVASASQDKTIKLWSSDDLSPVAVLRGHKRGVWSVQFSPVDRCIASSSADRTVKIWSVVDHNCLKTFQGHTASVLNLSFIKSGMQIMSTGADGLVKLWTVRTSECENTFDAHTDKIWALAVRPDSGEVITGGADSLVNVWTDTTASDEIEAIAQREEGILKEQDLQNSLRNRDFRRAIGLAFELKHPLRLWKVFCDIMETAGGGDDDESADGRPASSSPLDEYTRLWGESHIADSLNYIRQWNTNTRHSAVAQALLSSLLRNVAPSTLRKCPNALELVSSIIPYSERHFQRIDRLLQSSYVVDFTLTSMQMLLPEDGELGGVPAAAENGARMTILNGKWDTPLDKSSVANPDTGDDADCSSAVAELHAINAEQNRRNNGAAAAAATATDEVPVFGDEDSSSSDEEEDDSAGNGDGASEVHGFAISPEMIQRFGGDMAKLQKHLASMRRDRGLSLDEMMAESSGSGRRAVPQAEEDGAMDVDETPADDADAEAHGFAISPELIQRFGGDMAKLQKHLASMRRDRGLSLDEMMEESSSGKARSGAEAEAEVAEEQTPTKPKKKPTRRRTKRKSPGGEEKEAQQTPSSDRKAKTRSSQRKKKAKK